ncbi:MAG: oligosaccharide flippase family protein [Rhizobiales bacterium]|nr:oligosaccharide flippase family protein [Hyphomicrobiales bacterium]
MLKSASLFQRVLGAIMWALSGQITSMILRLVGLAYLARLLAPSDYGAFGAAFLCANILASIGRETVIGSLVNHRQPLPHHISSAFTLSVAVGCLGYIFLWAIGPLIGSFFHSQDVEALIPVLGLIVPVSILSATATGLLQSRFGFQKLAGAEVVAQLLNTAASILLATYGWGYWALAWGQIIAAVYLLATSYFLSPHNLKLTLRWHEHKEIIKYSSGYSLTQLSNNLGRNLDNIIVGISLGQTALGVYGRAFNLFTLPVTTLGLVIGRVLFPAFAEAKNDVGRLKRGYLGGIAICSLLLTPASVALWFSAHDIVSVILGGQWVGAGEPLKYLSIALLPRFSYKITETLSFSLGAVYGTALRQTLYAILVLVASLVGSLYGLEGVSIGVSLAIFVFYFLSAGLANQLVGVQWREFFAAHIGGLIIAATLGFGLGIFEFQLEQVALSSILRLLGIAAITLITYAVMLGLFARFILGNSAKSIIMRLKK